MSDENKNISIGFDLTLTETTHFYRKGWNAGCKVGYKEAFNLLLLNTKELINELGEEQGLKALRDWLKHELKSMGEEE